MKATRPLLAAFSLIAFSGAALAAGGSGQMGRQQGDPQEMQGQQQSRNAVPVSRLQDMKVVSAQGEDIGEVSDVVLNLADQRVHAVVVQSGGWFGIGGNNYAFPMSDFSRGKQRDQLVLNVDKQKLEDKQGFSKSQWPGMDDQYWTQGGSSAAAGASQGGQLNLVRASELEGQQVQDKSGKDVGEVKDVVVGLNDGQMRNLIVDVKDGGQARIPAKQLSRGTGDRLVVGMDAQQIRSQAKQSQRQQQGQPQ